MKLLDRWFPGRGHGVDELARRLDVDASWLLAVEPRYEHFTIPKRGGGRRDILAPERELKTLQRRILRRLLGRLKVHPAAMGFERGRSIVTNARAHQNQAVVLRFDIKNFFPSTKSSRVKRYFRYIGWNRPAARLLTRLCTWENALPQGAPTSPRLSNLVNYRLDARLAGMAAKLSAVYTRYADDMTVSFADESENESGHVVGYVYNPRTGRARVTVPTSDLGKVNDIQRDNIQYMQRFIRRVAKETGYQLHHRKKRSIRRRHQCQMVTGLVVNDRVNLPRKTRRWLRAVEYRTATQSSFSSHPDQPLDYRPHKRPTLTLAQLEGWRAYQAMVDRQADGK